MLNAGNECENMQVPGTCTIIKSHINMTSQGFYSFKIAPEEQMSYERKHLNCSFMWLHDCVYFVKIAYILENKTLSKLRSKLDMMFIINMADDCF